MILDHITDFGLQLLDLVVHVTIELGDGIFDLSIGAGMKFGDLCLHLFSQFRRLGDDRLLGFLVHLDNLFSDLLLELLCFGGQHGFCLLFQLSQAGGQAILELFSFGGQLLVELLGFRRHLGVEVGSELSGSRTDLPSDSRSHRGGSTSTNSTEQTGRSGVAKYHDAQ